MKFDKSRVFTAVNADEVKAGSKGYFADNLASLEPRVVSKSPLCTLAKISGPKYNCRFLDCYGTGFSLFYLVEEPEPEVEEVTAAEWDNRPHFMKVWNNYYEDSYNMLVVHIRSAEHSHPVVAVDCENEDICCFKHCAEIAAAKEPETEKKHYRPYKDSDEMIEDFKRRYNSYGGWSGKSNPMYCPLIWLKNVYTQEKELVRRFDRNYVNLGSTWDMAELLDKFTYLDGTHVGMKE